MLQWCKYSGPHKIPQPIPLWRGPQMARESLWATVLELPKNEDVYPFGYFPDELRDHIKLLWCEVSWKLPWYFVSGLMLWNWLKCCSPFNFLILNLSPIVPEFSLQHFSSWTSLDFTIASLHQFTCCVTLSHVFCTWPPVRLHDHFIPLG